MPFIIRSPELRADYSRIWHYIALDSPDNADRLLRSFDRALNMLASFPKAGRNRGRILSGLRSFPVGNYLIFYRPRADGIEVLRLLHGSMRIQRKLFQAPID